MQRCLRLRFAVVAFCYKNPLFRPQSSDAVALFPESCVGSQGMVLGK